MDLLSGYRPWFDRFSAKKSKITGFWNCAYLQKDQLKSRARKALRKLKEAKEIQKSIDNNKKLPMKFRINNVDYAREVLS